LKKFTHYTVEFCLCVAICAIEWHIVTIPCSACSQIFCKLHKVFVFCCFFSRLLDMMPFFLEKHMSMSRISKRRSLLLKTILALVVNSVRIYLLNKWAWYMECFKMCFLKIENVVDKTFWSIIEELFLHSLYGLLF